MAITITPTSPTGVGPGFVIGLSTDIIGVPAPDSRWEITILDVGENTVITQQQPYLGTPSSMTIAVREPGNGFSFGASNLLGGETVSISAKIQQPSVGVYDTGTLGSLTWNPTQNLVFADYFNTYYLLTHYGTFGPDQSAALEEIRAASFAPFGPDISVPIQSLIQAPPLGFLRRELITPDRNGEDTLTRVVGPVAVDAFGLAWEFVGVAPGIGVSEGAPDELFTKALELQLVHTLGDSTLIESAHAQFNFGDAFWIFSPMLPTYVRYWIGPGVTVRFFWLII